MHVVDKHNKDALVDEPAFPGVRLHEVHPEDEVHSSFPGLTLYTTE